METTVESLLRHQKAAAKSSAKASSTLPPHEHALVPQPPVPVPVPARLLADPFRGIDSSSPEPGSRARRYLFVCRWATRICIPCGSCTV